MSPLQPQGRLIPGAYKFDALITTFEMILSDCPELREIEWRCVIIDEAHRLKNRNCKLLDSLKHMDLVRGAGGGGEVSRGSSLKVEGFWFHLEMFWRCLGLFHTSMGCSEGGFGVLVPSGDVLEMFGPVPHPSGWFLEVHVGFRFHLEMFWRCLGLFRTSVDGPKGEFGVLVPPGDVVEMFGPVPHPTGWS